MSDGQVEVIPSSDPRLGRNINHDVRSRAFAVALGTVPTKSVRHRRYGTKLDQGDVGACTCFAGAHTLNTDPVRKARRTVPPTDRLMRNADALRFYHEATVLDPFPGTYPPDDTGSDGLSACKAMMSEGLISRYEWAFGFGQGLSGIAQYAWMQGTYWTENMMDTDTDGRIRPTGRDLGGHEYVWIGVEIRSKLVASLNRSWFLNSWGDGWGVNGYAYMRWPEHEELLARDGDLIRPVV